MIEEMNKVKALFPENVEKIIITKNDYDRLTGDLTLENIELEQEIERLNNIINEFEQWIKDSKRETLMGMGTINKIFFADELLDKIKELKGE